MTTKDYQTRSPLRIFLSYFKPHRRLFALDLSCAFLIACIDLAFPLVSRAAMYTWLPQRQFRVFFIVMAVVVAAYVLRSALYFVVAYWGHTFGIRVEADIRRDLYRHIQELGFDFYDRNRTGQLMSRLTSDLFELTELAHHGPEDLFISLVTIVGALAVMFTLRWELALVLLVLLPVLLTMALRRRLFLGGEKACGRGNAPRAALLTLIPHAAQQQPFLRAVGGSVQQFSSVHVMPPNSACGTVWRTRRSSPGVPGGSPVRR